MNSSSIQPVASRNMGIYETNHQISMWIDSLKADINQNFEGPTFVEADEKLDNSVKEEAAKEIQAQLTKYDHDGSKLQDKVLRRLAQNREAARKSRLRKKAYVQQLESSRMKLAQLEQELERFRQQGLYIGGNSGGSALALSGTVNPGVAAFEMEYGHWVEEQNRQISDLRAALQEHVSDAELRIHVENGLRLYNDLFRIKSIVAKCDVLYLMSGVWRSSAERLFLWIGGFRPSELLKVLSPQLEPLTEQQRGDVCNLQHTSQQAEDAFSQGLEKLQQTLSDTLICDPSSASIANNMAQMENAMEQLEALASFIDLADLLRQQTLQQMSIILTVHQAARGLLALGDYFQRLRALSVSWPARPQEPT